MTEDKQPREEDILQNREEQIAKAKRLAEKQLFVKAAQIYQKLGMEDEAAFNYETGGDYDMAIGIYHKLGKEEDVKRCEEKKNASAQTETWDDMHAKFQADLPYQ